MRKRIHAYLVIGIVFCVAIIALALLYFVFDLFAVDRGAVILLLFLFALAVTFIVSALRRQSRMREEMVRRFYLSPAGIYNYEIGFAPRSRITGGDDSLTLAVFMVDSLAKMSYGFEVAELPGDFQPQLLVDTEELLFHQLENEDGGTVVDSWKGLLYQVDESGDEDSYEELGAFDNARSLAFLLEENADFL